MAKRYVKALVLDGAFSDNELVNGQIVTLDLNQIKEIGTEPVIQVVGGGKRYVKRFAIDPILVVGRK